MKRTIATLILAGLVALPALAATRFPDVPSNHPRVADIEYVAAQTPAWFGGYPDGSFKPERTITAKQMAAVIGRAFPDGMTRAEFASFLRGGAARVAASPTTAPPTTAPPAAVEMWNRFGITSCEVMYQTFVIPAGEGEWDFNPDQYDPDRDTEGRNRFGSFASEDILRVTGWFNRFVSPSMFFCEGEAKLDNGRKLKLTVWASLDVDGDLFYNYWYPSADRPTCAEAAAADLNLLDYNVQWYYGQSNDPDRDGVMCEDVLPDDPQNPVGDPTGRSV